jgi:hypothetical protein
MSFVGIKRRRILHRFQNYKLTLVTKRLFQDKDFRLYTSLAADILNTAQIGPLRPLIRLVGVFFERDSLTTICYIFIGNIGKLKIFYTFFT